MWLLTPKYDKLSRNAIAGSNTRATIGMIKSDIVSQIITLISVVRSHCKSEVDLPSLGEILH
jgi:hypothetical protein